MRKLVLALLGIAVVAPPQSRAQSQLSPSAKVAFDVASIKPNTSGDRRTGMSPSRGRFSATNVTLRQLIQNSYLLQDFQIVGGPSWLNSARYDIEAKGNGGPGPEFQVMVQSLLADRFQLRIHRETKTLPIYVLLADKNGPRVKLAPSCVGETSPTNPCGGLTVTPRGDLIGRSVRMEQFAGNLSFLLHRTVLDKTELSQTYDLDLHWAPDEATYFSLGGSGAPSLDPNRPEIFTALREQLGLTLRAQKGPVSVLVIDHAVPPTEN
ncbi:MAG: TIGR03435 family protein [Acidobacteriia bacterium]|nr:TIGR03435 family protein [Terriglobia bacterium]